MTPDAASEHGRDATRSGRGRTLVIGVGHRDRCDDAVGPIVADLIQGMTDEVDTIVREGDLAVLPLLWEADDDVVIVDAVRSSEAPGSVQELDPSDLASGIGWSTHGMNVADAIELADRLDAMPRRLRVFGVAASRFDHGPMSPQMRGALTDVARDVLAAIGADPLSRDA